MTKTGYDPTAFQLITSFQGHLALENIAVNPKMLISTFPAGTYVGTTIIYNKLDENIMTVKYVQEIISNDRIDFK